MSLDSPVPPKQWPVGIIVSRSFDNPDLLPDCIGEHIASISHIHTNGAQPGSKLVEDFCRDSKIPYTVHPSTIHAFTANNEVVDASAFVYIVSDGKSKSAKNAEERCVAKGIKHKVLHYDPVNEWKKKVEWANEILGNMPKLAKGAAEQPVEVLRDTLEGVRKVLK